MYAALSRAIPWNVSPKGLCVYSGISDGIPLETLLYVNYIWLMKPLQSQVVDI